MFKTIRLLYCNTSRVLCPRDGEPFDAWPDPEETAVEQLQRAKREGWVRVGDKDYCPDCVIGRK